MKKLKTAASLAAILAVSAAGFAVVACGDETEEEKTGAPEQKYHVVYALDGGSGTLPTEPDHAAGDKFNLAASTGLTKLGYEFSKWKDDGGTEYDAGYEYTMKAGNVTFTAVWTSVSTYTVKYEAGNADATGTAPADQTVNNGTAITLENNPFTLEGQSFQGWAVYVNDASTNQVAYPGNSYTVGSDVVFKAVWAAAGTIANAYAENSAGTGAISISSEGGSWFIANEHDYEFTYTLDGDNITITFTDSAFTTKTFTGTYKNGVLSIVVQLGNNTYNMTTPAQAPTTAPTVTIDANGGTNAPAAPTPVYNGNSQRYKVTFPNGNTITPPDGKVFDHWNLSINNATPVPAGTNVNYTLLNAGETLKLIAVWEDAVLPDFQTEQYKYNENDETSLLSLKKYNGSAAKVVVPASLGIELIRMNAFGAGVTSIDFPASVKEFYSGALTQATDLEYIVLRRTESYVNLGGAWQDSANKLTVYAPDDMVEFDDEQNLYIYKGGTANGNSGDNYVFKPLSQLAGEPGPSTFVVTFNYNNGSENDTVIVDAGQPVQRPQNDPVHPDGKHFRYWAVNGNSYNFSTPVNSTLIISAYYEWKATFSAGEGQGTVDPLYIDQWAKGLTLPAGTGLTNGSKVFGGWNDGTTTYAAGDSYTAGTGDVTFTAVWNEPSSKFTVTVVKSQTENQIPNISGTVPTIADKDAGETFTIPADTFTFPHYHQTYWRLQRYNNGTSSWENVEDTYNYAPDATITMPACNIRIVAVWVANNITISFDANGGDGTMTAVTNKTFNSTYILPQCTFTKPDDMGEFDGWATSADGSKLSGTNIQLTADVVSADDTLTLYAKWKEPAAITINDFVGKWTNSAGSLQIAASDALEGVGVAILNGKKALTVVTNGTAWAIYDGSSDDPYYTATLANGSLTLTPYEGDPIVYNTKAELPATTLADFEGSYTRVNTGSQTNVFKLIVGDGKVKIGAEGSETEKTFAVVGDYLYALNATANLVYVKTDTGLDCYINGAATATAYTKDTAAVDPYAPTITFVSAGGTGTAPTATITYNSTLEVYKVKLPANSYTAPEGKEFDCWTVVIGTDDPEDKTPEAEFNVSKNATVTVTAKWKDATSSGGGSSVTWSAITENTLKTLAKDNGTTSGSNKYYDLWLPTRLQSTLPAQYFFGVELTIDSSENLIVELQVHASNKNPSMHTRRKVTLNAEETTGTMLCYTGGNIAATWEVHIAKSGNDYYITYLKYTNKNNTDEYYEYSEDTKLVTTKPNYGSQD